MILDGDEASYLANDFASGTNPQRTLCFLARAQIDETREIKSVMQQRKRILAAFSKQRFAGRLRNSQSVRGVAANPSPHGLLIGHPRQVPPRGVLCGVAVRDTNRNSCVISKPQQDPAEPINVAMQYVVGPMI